MDEILPIVTLRALIQSVYHTTIKVMDAHFSALKKKSIRYADAGVRIDAGKDAVR